MSDWTFYLDPESEDSCIMILLYRMAPSYSAKCWLQSRAKVQQALKWYELFSSIQPFYFLSQHYQNSGIQNEPFDISLFISDSWLQYKCPSFDKRNAIVLLRILWAKQVLKMKSLAGDCSGWKFPNNSRLPTRLYTIYYTIMYPYISKYM